jgi:hypothetical protein
MMLDKILKAFGYVKSDLEQLKKEVHTLQAIKPIVKNGRDGKDGRDAPDLETIVKAVLSEIPEPEKIDIQAVLDKIPTPKDGRDGKDGRDAPPVSVSDVATVVLAQIPKPKDGKNGRDAPDLETIVKKVQANIKNGEQGPAGARGPRGSKGVSVTDVELSKDNELSVFLDGVKKKVGKIKIPRIVAPFSPAGGGGAGSYANGHREYLGWGDYVDTQYTQGSPLSISANTDVILPNNAQSGPRFQEPQGIELFKDGKISGRNGDSILYTLDFKAIPVNANATVLETWVDIGGTVGELYRRLVTFPKGTGVERPVTLTTMAYTLDTWEQNGGAIYIRCNGDLNIYDIRVIISRLHRSTQ